MATINTRKTPPPPKSARGGPTRYTGGSTLRKQKWSSSLFCDGSTTHDNNGTPPCAATVPPLTTKMKQLLLLQRFHHARQKWNSSLCCNGPTAGPPYLGEVRVLLEVGGAPVNVAMPAGRVSIRQEVHRLALVRVRHDPPSQARNHRHHVSAPVEVSLGDHLSRAGIESSQKSVHERGQHY